MKPNLHYLRQGMASLTLVLIVVALISLIMIPIFLVTYIRNTQAVRFYHSQQAFFAAEGAYAETVGRIKSFPGWVTDGNLVNDSYVIPPNNITRLVTNHSGVYDITITADNRLAQRKIEGVFTPAGTTTTTVDNDIMFVLDYSSSMTAENLTDLKQATISILETIANNYNNRAGVVIFATPTVMGSLRSFNQTHDDPYDPSIDPEMQELVDLINDTTFGPPVDQTFTNTGDALQEAISELNTNFIADRKRYIIVFSDGIPNRPLHLSCPNTESLTIKTDPFLPAQYDIFDNLNYYGNECTHYPIFIARIARNTDNPDTTNNIIFYSILLTNMNNDPPNYIADLGRLILFGISSNDDDPALRYRFVDPGTDLTMYEFYKQTADSSEISNIFTSITSTISSGGSSNYGEAVPD